MHPHALALVQSCSLEASEGWKVPTSLLPFLGPVPPCPAASVLCLIVYWLLARALGPSPLGQAQCCCPDCHARSAPAVLSPCLACSPGWLVHWGEKMANTSADVLTDSFKDILAYNNGTGSVNFYMAHGGTNFAWTAGPRCRISPVSMAVEKPCTAVAALCPQTAWDCRQAFCASGTDGHHAFSQLALSSSMLVCLARTQEWYLCLMWLRASRGAAGAGIALYGSHKGLGPTNLAAGNSYQPHITSYDYDCMVSEAGDYGQPGIGGPNKYEASSCMPSRGAPGRAQKLLNANWLPVQPGPNKFVWRPSSNSL